MDKKEEDERIENIRKERSDAGKKGKYKKIMGKESMGG